MIPGEGLFDGKGKGCLIKLIVALVAVYAVYKFLWPTYSWRQKLTLTIETPAGGMSGAAVVEATVTNKPDILPEGKGVFNSWKGEATVTDLGGGRYLFALLGHPVYMAQKAYWAAAGIEGRERKAPALYRKFESWFSTPDPVELQPINYPLLVTFGDIADPASVKRVDPLDMDGALGLCADGTGLKDEDAPWRAEGMMSRRWAQWQASGLTLEEFEEDYPGHIVATDAVKRRFMTSVPLRDTSADCHQLKSITLAITSDPVTDGEVEQVLGWLLWPREKLLAAGDGRNPVQIQNNGGLLALGRTDFRRK